MERDKTTSSKCAKRIKFTDTGKGNKNVVQKHRWTDAENQAILNYLIDTIHSGQQIEKPSAKDYYEQLIKDKLLNVTIVQVKNQVRNLKTKYLETIDWRNQTGQGLVEDSGEKTLQEVLLNKCPHFLILDQVYGERIHVTPPFIHDSFIPEIVMDNVDLSDKSDNTNIPQQSPPTTPSENVLDPKIDDKKQLGLKRKIKKSPTKTGLSVLAETAKMRFDLQQNELKLSQEKWDFEKLRFMQKDGLESQKFDFQKIIDQRKLALEEKKIENEYEIAKFRIAEEMKLKLELAKMQSSSK